MSETNGQPIICVFGSYAPLPGEPLYELAYRIGHALARAGYAVANGGYGGVMEASHKGAKEAGGRTIGATCSIFKDREGELVKPNPYVDHAICHPDLLTRIDAMMRMAAGYVVLEGGTGTLSELGIVWEYVAKGFIEPRPIFLVGGFWRPVMDCIIAARPKHGTHLHCVESEEEIIRGLKLAVGAKER